MSVSDRRATARLSASAKGNLFDMNEKSPARLWLENFWYHNKWKTIFVLFIASVVLICLLQIGNVTQFDAQVLYTGPYLFTPEEKAELESAFTQLLQKDYNEDGRKNCQVADLSIFTDEQLVELLKESEDPADMIKYGQYSEEARGRSFTQEITAGENVICLLDPHWYSLIKEKGGLLELKHLLGDTPENAIDSYGIRLKDTDFGKYFAVFDALPDDTILCMRVLSSSMMISQNKQAEKRHEQHKEIFRTVCDFTLPQGFVPRPAQTAPVTKAASETPPTTDTIGQPKDPA